MALAFLPLLTSSPLTTIGIIYALRVPEQKGHKTAIKTASHDNHDNHDNINSWVSFSFLYEYGPSLGGPSGR